MYSKFGHFSNAIVIIGIHNQKFLFTSLFFNLISNDLLGILPRNYLMKFDKRVFELNKKTKYMTGDPFRNIDIISRCTLKNGKMLAINSEFEFDVYSFYFENKISIYLRSDLIFIGFAVQ